MPDFVMAARSRASAIFYPGDSFALNCQTKDGEPFLLSFSTTYKDAGFDAPLPVDLCVEARGKASGIGSALDAFTNGALEVSTYVALVANATMGKLEPEIIFDVTPNTSERDFFQTFVPDQPVTVVPGRRIDIELLNAFLKVLIKHPERERLGRAAAQYVEALRSWRPGHEITCVAHLFMGVEALAPAVLREHLRLANKTEDQIVEEWNIEYEYKGQRENKLNGQVRRRLIFRGDDDCAKKTREVSDGFEHGYSDYSSMLRLAVEVVEKAAGYLRRAIFETSGIDPVFLERALGSGYSIPRGPLVLVRHIQGKLTGSAEQLAEDGQLYPMLRWQTNLQKVSVGENGIYEFAQGQNLTGSFGPGIVLSHIRCRGWDGSTMTPVELPGSLGKFSKARPSGQGWRRLVSSLLKMLWSRPP